MLEGEARKCSFVLVGNIPSELKSADLRAFFSHLVEKRGFVCFHYRHRPEHAVTQQPPGNQATPAGSSQDVPESSVSEAGEGENASEFKIPTAVTTRCCVAALTTRLHEHELLKRYGGRHWAKSGGELLRRKVKLSRLSVFFEETETQDSESTGGIPWSDLCTLLELNPPSVMPYGNVGTPTSVFMELIRQCKLPGRVIKKLDLEFPKKRSKRRYGAVGLDYGEEVIEGENEEREEEDEEEVRRERRGRNKESGCRDETGEEEEEPLDDDFDAEEWERYEALHDDVDKQGRTKDRLYEEEMEVVWEKGGSGLVFYTDASHWHNLEGDFDEQCSKEDDWDVDTSLYYDPEGGDKSARDLKDMRHEQSIRDGAQQASVFGGFEKYTKGIGSKVLKKSGWREGSGVGRASDGISEPVDTDGQHPKNKTGLGYRGESFVRHASQKEKRPHRRATRDVIISTVYDRPDEEELTELRSAPSRTIKYRQQGIKFVTGPTLKPTSHKHNQSS